MFVILEGRCRLPNLLKSDFLETPVLHPVQLPLFMKLAVAAHPSYLLDLSRHTLPQTLSVTALLMVLSRRVSKAVCCSALATFQSAPLEQQQRLKGLRSVADCMAQQHRDSQDGSVSFSISSLCQSMGAESSPAPEGLAWDRAQ